MITDHPRILHRSEQGRRLLISGAMARWGPVDGAGGEVEESSEDVDASVSFCKVRRVLGCL